MKALFHLAAQEIRDYIPAFAQNSNVKRFQPILSREVSENPRRGNVPVHGGQTVNACERRITRLPYLEKVRTSASTAQQI